MAVDYSKAYGYKTFNLDEAREMKTRYKECSNLTFEFEKQHFERFKSRVEESIASSKTYIGLITVFKLIAIHATIAA